MLSLAAAGQADATTALQQRLYAQFKLTTVMADRSDIMTPGDVVDIPFECWSIHSAWWVGSSSVIDFNKIGIDAF
jgi:hypothetical protein